MNQKAPRRVATALAAAVLAPVAFAATPTFQPVAVVDFTAFGDTYNVHASVPASFVGSFANPVFEDFSSFTDPEDCNDIIVEHFPSEGRRTFGNFAADLIGDDDPRGSQCGFYIHSGVVRQPVIFQDPAERYAVGIYPTFFSDVTTAFSVGVGSGESFTAFAATLYELRNGCTLDDLSVIIDGTSYPLSAPGAIQDPNSTPVSDLSGGQFGDIVGAPLWIGFSVDQPITEFTITSNDITCEVQLDDITFDVVSSGSACSGDVTGDGLTNADDLLLILGNFGSTTTDGDLTGDGLVNADDLLAVLGDFGCTG